MKRKILFCFFLLLIVWPAYAESAVTRNLTPKESIDLIGQRSDLSC